MNPSTPSIFARPLFAFFFGIALLIAVATYASRAHADVTINFAGCSSVVGAICTSVWIRCAASGIRLDPPTRKMPTRSEAAVAVLHHNGMEVYVPPGQRGCGMAPLAYGDVETAREVAVHNVRILADLAREGYTIVCSEPTAALMLRQDYLDLVDDPDARLVADHVSELTSFLWDLHLQGRLRTDFQPLELSIGHHVPCHLKAVGRPAAGPPNRTCNCASSARRRGAAHIGSDNSPCSFR